jgi:flagellin-like protein
MKAITPIIAIIVLLLITIALAGAAWTFMSSLSSGYTQKAFQPVDSFCAGGFATMVIKNVGTDPIEISDTAIQKEPYDVDSDTLVLYHFEGNAESATGVNHGIMEGVLTCTAPGRFGQGCYVDGSGNQYINATDDDSLSPQIDGNATWSIWIKPEPTGSSRYVFGKGVPNDWEYAILMSTTGRLTFSLFQPGSSSVYKYAVFVSSDTVNFDEWNHVVATWENGVNFTGYINGEFVGYNDSFAGTMVNGPGDLLVGRINAGGFFQGTFDEFRIYNESMTLEELRNQPSWGYTCSGSGTSRQCGDITLTKTSGSGLDPHFGKGSVSEGETVTIKDPCVDETCKYRIITTTMASTVTLNC